MPKGRGQKKASPATKKPRKRLGWKKSASGKSTKTRVNQGGASRTKSKRKHGR